MATKKQKTDETVDMQALSKLQEIQDNLEKVNDELNDKILELEKESLATRKPFYNTRNKVIESIPNFWLTVFLNDRVLGNLIQDQNDQDALSYLTQVNVEDHEDIKSGYKITFTFKENPYFENKEIFKEFSFLENGELKVSSTQIKWKPGKDLTAPPPDASGKKRKEAEVCMSFFHLFGEDDEDTLIGERIKEDIWLNPLKKYMNEGDDSDLEEYSDEGEDEDDGEEDEEEDGDDQS